MINSAPNAQIGGTLCISHAQFGSKLKGAPREIAERLVRTELPENNAAR